MITLGSAISYGPLFSMSTAARSRISLFSVTRDTTTFHNLTICWLLVICNQVLVEEDARKEASINRGPITSAGGDQPGTSGLHQHYGRGLTLTTKVRSKRRANESIRRTR